MYHLSIARVIAVSYNPHQGLSARLGCSDGITDHCSLTCIWRRQSKKSRSTQQENTYQMRNVCLAVLFLGILFRVDVAYGQQCGSSRSDDGPGPYASSTSSDHCAFGPLQPATVAPADLNISTVEFPPPAPVLYSTAVFISDTDGVWNTFGSTRAENEAARFIRRRDEGERS